MKNFCLLGLAVLMCLGVVFGCAQEKVNLKVYAFFTQSVVVNIAHELVDAYEPAQGTQTANVAWPYYYGTFAVTNCVKGAVYDGHYSEQEPEKSYKPAFLRAVRMAGQHPKLVRKFYSENVDRVISEMVVYAKRPVDSGYHKRPAYSEFQVREMFRLYAIMSEKAIPFLKLASKPDKVTIAKADSIFVEEAAESRSVAADEAWTHIDRSFRLQRELEAHLQKSSGIKFGEGDFFTWQFGYRRYKAGGPKLCRAIISLTEDAAKRSRIRATS